MMPGHKAPGHRSRGRMNVAGRGFYKVLLPVRVSIIAEFIGSLVVTRFFFDAPLVQDFEPTVSTTFPSPPGGIDLSKWVTQTPQPGRIFLITNSEVPTFFMMNVWL